MSRLPRAPFALAVALLLAAPAHAQITGHPLELSGGAGGVSPDARARIQSGFASTAALGWRWLPGISLEAQATFGPSHADTLPNQKHNLTYAGLDARWNLRPAESRTVPFVLVGLGYGISHTGGHAPESLERGAGSVGLGLLQAVGGQRHYLRLQVRDEFFREREALTFSNHWYATAGLQVIFGGKAHDADLDGVRDWLDQCPATPIGATVDAKGCPKDSDGDGVLDGLDQCPGTPKGCTIDKKGCPSDADGDGVCDGLDTCPDTPKGATVDAHGCPADPDSDGVMDGIDKCPGTPKGCTVDATGCPKDSDGDGVCDGLDVCPNTPAGLRVDAHGCPIEVNEKETQLLDTGTIRLGNVLFDTGKATLRPEAFTVLDTIGMILQQYPTLRIEIGGHTDNRGTADKNQKLSEARADSVLGYLRGKFPTLNADQFSAKGYGLTRPIAPNTTELGRAKNRRVEFRVLNTDALRIERERRRFLKRDEGLPTPAPAPAPSPAPAAPDTTKH
ncbi:MAG TPA: OmpA family protein [Candidatus Saccharimonadaceae bacterium]|jgi:outer membrane protein OmpA-like peptidoglycan-associated protein|nr:OmpA family protein [Candidatus Saccharimonadaceae bacterium]